MRYRLTFKGHNAYGSALLYVEGSLDRLVQFIEFVGVARPSDASSGGAER